MKRVAMNLRPKEIAVLELAREDFSSVEVPLIDVKARFEDLMRAGDINRDRIKGAAMGEPRAVRRYIAGLFAA